MLKIDQKMSSLHRALYRLLCECGIRCEVEVAKGPYRIDCFSADLNLAFEADGPCHGRRREAHPHWTHWPGLRSSG